MTIRSAVPPRPAVRARRGRWHWSDEAVARVEARLRRMGRVYQALPAGRVMPAAFRSSWPDAPDDRMLAFVDRLTLTVRVGRWRPSAADISEADAVAGWIVMIADVELRLLLWARAFGFSWAEIAAAHQTQPEPPSVRTLRRRHRAALMEIVMRIEKNLGTVGPVGVPSAA